MITLASRLLGKLSVNEVSRSTHYRPLGFLSLLLFGARYVELAIQGKTAHILWICHISSLIIALGFFLGRIELIRISVLWLIIGAPLWPIEIMRTGIMEVTSIGTHYVGLLIGLLVIKRQDMGKYSWVFALLWFLLLQQVTRFIRHLSSILIYPMLYIRDGINSFQVTGHTGFSLPGVQRLVYGLLQSCCRGYGNQGTNV